MYYFIFCVFLILVIFILIIYLYPKWQPYCTDIRDYTLLSIFFSGILYILYLRFQYPFWFLQPVHHSYNFIPKIWQTPYIIQNRLPTILPLCNLNSIQTISTDTLSETDWDIYMNMLQCHYFHHEKMMFLPEKKQIQSLFQGHSSPCYISFYRDKQYIQDNTNTKSTIISVFETEPVAVMASRPIFLFARKESTEVPRMISIYFWDWICIRRNREKKIIHQLIQTHIYHVRHKNPAIVVSMFKQENQLCEGVVPLVEYPTSLFFMENQSISKILPHYKIHRIWKHNMHFLVDILEKIREKTPDLFEFIAISDIATYSAWILSELWFMYVLTYTPELTQSNSIIAVYIFKDATSVYEEYESNGYILRFIASILYVSPTVDNIQLFYQGFLQCLRDTVRQDKEKPYRLLLFETISHNRYLLEIWKETNTCICTYSTAYYLYNMVYPNMPIIYSDVLCLI